MTESETDTQVITIKKANYQHIKSIVHLSKTILKFITKLTELHKTNKLKLKWKILRKRLWYKIKTSGVGGELSLFITNTYQVQGQRWFV